MLAESLFAYKRSDKKSSGSKLPKSSRLSKRVHPMRQRSPIPCRPVHSQCQSPFGLDALYSSLKKSPDALFDLTHALMPIPAQNTFRFSRCFFASSSPAAAKRETGIRAPALFLLAAALIGVVLSGTRCYGRRLILFRVCDDDQGLSCPVLRDG